MEILVSNGSSAFNWSKTWIRRVLNQTRKTGWKEQTPQFKSKRPSRILCWGHWRCFRCLHKLWLLHIPLHKYNGLSIFPCTRISNLLRWGTKSLCWAWQFLALVVSLYVLWNRGWIVVFFRTPLKSTFAFGVSVRGVDMLLQQELRLVTYEYRTSSSECLELLVLVHKDIWAEPAVSSAAYLFDWF